MLQLRAEVAALRAERTAAAGGEVRLNLSFSASVTVCPAARACSKWSAGHENPVGLPGSRVWMKEATEPYSSSATTAQGRRQSPATAEVESAPRPAAAVTVGELDFAVDQYIVIGSPLGLFLALRKVLRS